MRDYTTACSAAGYAATLHKLVTFVADTRLQTTKIPVPTTRCETRPVRVHQLFLDLIDKAQQLHLNSPGADRRIGFFGFFTYGPVMDLDRATPMAYRGVSNALPL